MVPQAIRIAEKAFQKYKTRDPFEIIEDRHIKLKYFERPEDLLGFYTVMNKRQIIGLNTAADDMQKLTGAIHEIGHSLNDYRFAASGGHFADFRFFSFSVMPAESNANLAGAHLFIPDEYILDTIHYTDFRKTVEYIGEHREAFRSDRAKLAFEEEQMQEFYDMHSDLPSFSEIAADLGVAAGVVKYKCKALNYKGYDLPNIPETRSDFLRNWRGTLEN